jgi:hypothetical protein
MKNGDLAPDFAEVRMKPWFSLTAGLMAVGFVTACSATSSDGTGGFGGGSSVTTGPGTSTSAGGTGGTGTGGTGTGGSGGAGGAGGAGTGGAGGAGGSGGAGGGVGGSGGTGGIGVGGSGGTGGVMDCGTLTVADPVCQDCLTATCCAQLKACSDEIECIDLLNCESACVDPTCIDTCVAAYPVGAPLVDAVNMCFGACAPDCGGGSTVGICDSGLTITDPPACEPCLTANCCDEFVACSGGTDVNGNPLDDAQVLECIDCLNAGPGMDPPGADCVAADAAETCANTNCAVECVL